MDCSMSDFPVFHYLPELSQTHVHWVGDVIQTSHPLLPLLLLHSFSPASESFPVSQLFESGGQSIWVSASVSVLPMNIQSWFPLGWTGLISLMSKGLSGVLSNATSLYRNLQILPSAKPSKSKLWTGHLTSHSPTQPNTITALLELNNSIQYLSHTQMAPLVPDNFLIAFLNIQDMVRPTYLNAMCTFHLPFSPTDLYDTESFDESKLIVLQNIPLSEFVCFLNRFE